MPICSCGRSYSLEEHRAGFWTCERCESVNDK